MQAKKCEKKKPPAPLLIRTESIEQKIYFIRGQKVMFDRDLSRLYGITTGNFNKAVSRNLERFPGDFMFQLTSQEWKNLIFQIGTSSWGGTRKPPRVFTEHGVLMLSSVLRSRKAVLLNIEIMRVFAKLRRLIASHKNILQRLDSMEKRYDHQFKIVFDAIRSLVSPPTKPKRPIGFHYRP